MLLVARCIGSGCSTLRPDPMHLALAVLAFILIRYARMQIYLIVPLGGIMGMLLVLRL